MTNELEHDCPDRPGSAGYGALRPDRTGQAEAFDAIGGRYDEAFPHKDGQVEATDWLVGALPAGARVLDLGCGTGLPTARRLAEGAWTWSASTCRPGWSRSPASTCPRRPSTRRTSPTCAPAARSTSAASTR